MNRNLVKKSMYHLPCLRNTRTIASRITGQVLQTQTDRQRSRDNHFGAFCAQEEVGTSF